MIAMTLKFTRMVGEESKSVKQKQNFVKINSLDRKLLTLFEAYWEMLSMKVFGWWRNMKYTHSLSRSTSFGDQTNKTNNLCEYHSQWYICVLCWLTGRTTSRRST